MYLLKNFYLTVESCVCRHTGWDACRLVSCNKEECVDARAILVHLLVEQGLTDGEIAMLSTLSRQCVNKLKNGFHERMKKFSVRVTLQGIKKELACNELATNLPRTIP